MEQEGDGMSRLIDADAMIDRLKQWDTKDKIDKALYNFTLNRVNEQPTVQSEPHWIPVTERLPENGEQVLVYARSVHYALAKYDEMREADGTYKKQWVTFDAWKPFYTIKEVIAWMPLPEPYQEGEQDG